MPRGLFFALVLCAPIASCGRPGTVVAPDSAPSVGGARDVQAPPSACNDPVCLTRAADDAQAQGQLDVASRYLERAHAVDPSDERLAAWLDALEKTGQTRRLAAALQSQASGHAAVVGRHPPPVASDGPTLPPVANHAVAHAFELERTGELAAAEQALAGVDHPAWRARRAVILDKLGRKKEAATAFAETRIGIDERGGRMRLAPFETTSIEGLTWSDGHAVRLVDWRPMEPGSRLSVTAIEHLTDGERFDVAQRLLLRTEFEKTGGSRLYGWGGPEETAEPTPLIVHDLRTGSRLGSLDGEFDDLSEFEVLDDGPARRYLIETTDQDTTIWTLAGPDPIERGPKLGTFSIAGTTPTITRVYRQRKGTRHDNILEDSPSWPVAFAVDDTARHVAIGTSDSSVYLFDVRSGKRKQLGVKWTYEEFRHRGGNPDQNHPVALGFSNDVLTAVFNRGDIVRWTTRGRKLSHQTGRCDRRELASYAGRYGSSDPISDEDKAECGRLLQAWLSPSGSRVATTGSFDLRVLDTSSADSLTAPAVESLGAHALAWSDENGVVFSNLYGQVWQWKAGEDVVSRTEKRDGLSAGRNAVRLSSNLQVLQWGGDLDPIVAWDLHRGDALATDVPVRSTSSATLEHHISAVGQEFFVSNAAGTKVYPFDHELAQRIFFLSESGYHLLSRREGALYFVDLESVHEQKLDVPPGGSPYENRARVTTDGTRVAVLGADLVLRVFETETGAVISSTSLPNQKQKRYRGDVALGPDGSWVAWQEQLERPERGLPDLRVHLVGIDRGVQDRTIVVKGWGQFLVPDPSRDGLLIATENTLTRWNVRTGQSTDETFGSVGANSLHFGADGTLVLFERHGRVDIRANAPGMPLQASVYALDNGGWFVRTVGGAVDGSANATERLATVIDGPLDGSVLPGGVAWDRFAVPHLLADPKGYRGVPPGTR